MFSRKEHLWKDKLPFFLAPSETASFFVIAMRKNSTYRFTLIAMTKKI